MKFKKTDGDRYFTVCGKIKQVGIDGTYETTDKEEIEELKKSKDFREVKDGKTTKE